MIVFGMACVTLACASSSTDTKGDGGGPAGDRATPSNMVKGKTIILTDCMGSAISGKATAIAKTSTGLVAVVETTSDIATIERYTGQGCNLTKDATYQPAAAPAARTQVAVDGSDHVYFGSVGATGSQTTQLDATGKLVQHHVQATAEVAVSTDGLTLYTSFVGTPVRSTRASATSVFAMDGTFTSPTVRFVGGILARSSGTSLIGGQMDVGTPFHVFSVNNSGMITAMYGSANMSAPSSFCDIGALTSCGSTNGFCVADFNCHKVLVFNGTGEYQDGFDLGASQPLSLAPISSSQIYHLRSSAEANGPNVLGIISMIP